jgi:hypothetical protein
MEEPKIDTTTPHPARRYNWWLGGKDNFAVDRASGGAIADVFPNVVTAALENLRFLRRVVRYLAGECGVRQFLDIGTGLPVEPHVHDVAAGFSGGEDLRVVYVDNDPMVLVNARSLKTAQPPSAAGYIDGDLRDPDTILKDPILSGLLDLEQPVGVLIVAVTHFLPDNDLPREVIGRIMAAMPSGSYLALSQVTYDDEPADQVAKLRALTDSGLHGPFQARDREGFARLFDGLDLVDPPGVVRVTGWRPDLEPCPLARWDEAAVYAGVAKRV